LLPPPGDFIAEVQTRRFGWLTYARSGLQAEDITLFSRERRRTISLYPSKDKLAARGRFYTEDSLLEFDVLDYNIEAAIDPDTQLIQGRARLSVRIRDDGTNTLTLRLAESLTVSSIVSLEYGRLLHLRVRNQNTIIISLPTTLTRDTDITLVLTYSGRIRPQDVESEVLRPQGQDDLSVVVEPSYLLSNRSYWYPQNPVSDYATATLRLTVPRGYGCVASGQEVATAGSEVTLRDLVTMPGGRTFVFRANEPLRYLAFVVSRFTRVAQSTVVVTPPDDRPRFDRQRTSVTLTVDANPRQIGRGREILGPLEDIMRFYATLLGDAPYASATVALVESELPGGHSPGYFAMVNNPVGSSPVVWRNDPAAFTDFPDFFVAHELAHQWWGQAVGWKNYHEQWISEGFAQYFAALYAQKTRGEGTFLDMLRQFRRWALSESSEGPIYLGYRLGHIRNDSRVFRALVYNKGAAVLHMLRRLVGDEVFFRALRTFYDEQKFKKAGTDDLQRVFESASGRKLDRFFERWIYESDIPTVRYSSAVDGSTLHLRFEQSAARVVDLPVTVTVTYTNGRVQDVVIPVTDALVERQLPLDGAVRQVQINRDNAALAAFEEF
jgi:aminopeptidase N